MSYIAGVLTLILIYVILAVSLNLAIGYTGLLNLGHVAFFGIGAYTSALLVGVGVPYFFALLLAGVFASAFGYVLVLATNKLKGDYLALATLGFSFVMFSLFLNVRVVTNGALGLAGISAPSFFGFDVITRWGMFWYVLLVCSVCVFLMHRVVKSPFGRLLQATRDDDMGLRVLGKSTFLLKVKAMMISAFFAGISGSLFAHYITFIEPNSFTLTALILMLTIVIVGGLASIKGSVIGAFVILLIPEVLRLLNLASVEDFLGGIIQGSLEGTLPQILYALILLGILLYRPRGLFGRIDLE